MSVSQSKGPHDTWIVSVSGRLDQSQGPALEGMLVALAGSDGNRIIVDLSDTTYINSGGLRILVTTWRLLKQRDGDLVLVGLGHRLMDVFGMVGFDKVFRIAPDMDAAVRQLERR